MLFTSYKYALFVAAVFVVYYLVSPRSRGGCAQNLVLLAASYTFYALWDWRGCFLLAGVTATGFLGGLLLDRARSNRTLVLVAVLAIDLAVLAFFKYRDFLSQSFADVLRTVGLQPDWTTVNLVLPLGISYFVFQNLSYVIDAYRGDLRATRRGLDYAVALSFFPQLLAGPITRPRALLPQLSRGRTFDDERAADGLRQVLWGLTKKMLIADNIGAVVDEVWADVGAVDGLTLVIVALLYSVHIYCDFSGYADIAIGSAKLFNLRLSKNFAYPYFSTSVRMFWRRWHITLASWMRDYVYIPLGGNRVTVPRHTFNLLVTFLLVGLWHGANWTFVVWGLLHGTYLAAGAQWSRLRAGAAENAKSRMAAAASAIGVFLLVTFAWVFFRAPTLGDALTYLGGMVSGPFAEGEHGRFVPVLLLSAVLFVYEWLTRRWEHGLAIGGLPLPVRWAAYLGLCMVLLVFAELGGREGIYVQF